MPIDPKRVQAVFLMAVEYQGAGDRAAVLDRECATDLELRQRVLVLLRSHDEPDRFLDQPVVPALPSVVGKLCSSRWHRSVRFRCRSYSRYVSLAGLANRRIE